MRISDWSSDVCSAEAAAKQSQKPVKQRKQKGNPLPEGNPAAFRTWYVPDGVDTAPSGHRNADGRGPKKPYGKKPGGGQGRPGAGGNRPFGNEGGDRKSTRLNSSH